MPRGIVLVDNALGGGGIEGALRVDKRGLGRLGIAGLDRLERLLHKGAGPRDKPAVPGAAPVVLANLLFSRFGVSQLLVLRGISSHAIDME